jgi:cellulose biosynthesis protein BcsQ
MKSIAIFNNKGGVGKSTLTYHLGYALAELGYKTLLVDLDPQSNLTLYGLSEEELHKIWEIEDPFIDDFVQARKLMSPDQFKRIVTDVRSIHFLLKPTEDGTDNPPNLSKPLVLNENLGLIPGRLSIHTFEDRIASRWNDVYGGDPLAIRTVTRIRSLCAEYAENHSYDFVVIDTSPSLGILNKVIISTVDGFLIPCMPDMFSLYGIQNIGKSLKRWKRDFDTIFKLLSDTKLRDFPESFVSFLGFTIFNARKYTGSGPLNLAKAHSNYAEQIPATIREHIQPEHWRHLSEDQLEQPISTSVMHSYATRPNMAQKYKMPMWQVPSCRNLDTDDKGSILGGNRHLYEATRDDFHIFAKNLLTRLQQLEVDNGS